MRLTVIGSSDAFNSAGRSHSSYLLEAEGVGGLLVDLGATTVAALRRHGRSPGEVAGVAITHLHGDHIGGYPFLVIDGMFNEVRRHSLAIVGPRHATNQLDATLRVAYGALADRERPFATSIRELEPGAQTELVGWN
ncbi:MAG: MBL fold metallo-hydrolase, partial [Deltaproteobacteria bacterium]|nr:MBL fold metallo-hydrolase [Deltaproteobacteria bacterium]